MKTKLTVNIQYFFSIRHYGYYFFRCSFCAAAIRGWLLFEGAVGKPVDINNCWRRYMYIRVRRRRLLDTVSSTRSLSVLLSAMVMFSKTHTVLAQCGDRYQKSFAHVCMCCVYQLRPLFEGCIYFVVLKYSLDLSGGVLQLYCNGYYLLPDFRDLDFLKENLQPIANKWRAIGLQLGLSSEDLDRIETTPILIIGGPASFLEEVLSKWLDCAPPSPTLTKLCVALKSHEVRQSRMTQELKQHYKTKRTGSSACS